MLLNTGKKQYRIMREVLKGEVNDVCVCQNQDESTAPYKTVWIVRDRRIAKELMGKLDGVCEECFMHNEDAGFVFGYDGERPLARFYPGAVQNNPAAEPRIWLELVVRCMTSGLPPAVLNLILRQRQIQISSDGSIWFGYFLDLAEYDSGAGERENTALCAARILELAESGPVLRTETAKNIRVMKLLQKKLDREKYQEFMQLYSDIKLMTRESEPRSRKAKITAIAASRRDLFCRGLAALCIALVFVVILMIAGHLFFGEYSFWKLFQDPLERIGTESLLQ